jgi:DNA-binding MarR family transcriptional regulator
VNDVSSSAPSGQPTTESKLVAGELLAATGAIRRVVRRAVRNSAVAQALPPARSELLRLTARQPGISVADAAHELRLAPNSVSTMVSQLTADGLLTRSRADSDGRSVRLAVTPAGAERIAQWQDIRADVAGRALDLISEPDREAIRAAIPALNRLAEQMEAPVSERAAQSEPEGAAARDKQMTHNEQRTR